MSQSTQFLGPVVPLAMFVFDISEIEGTKKIDFKTINVGRHKKWRKNNNKSDLRHLDRNEWEAM